MGRLIILVDGKQRYGGWWATLIWNVSGWQAIGGVGLDEACKQGVNMGYQPDFWLWGPSFIGGFTWRINPVYLFNPGNLKVILEVVRRSIRVDFDSPSKVG